MDLRDKLPPEESWPGLLPISDVAYPEHLNASLVLLDENIKQDRGSHTAIRFGAENITYTELLDRVERFSASLVSAGIRRGDRILLRFPNRPEFIIAWLSILRLGAVAVPTMPLLRARELRSIMQDCIPRLAICQDALLDELKLALADFPEIQLVVNGPSSEGHDSFQDWLKPQPKVEPVVTRADDVALLLYTSGSTGEPKGAAHFHRDILAITDTYSRHVLNPSKVDIISGHPTLAFAYGLGGLLVIPFRVGATTVLIERFTPEEMLQAFRDHAVTIAFCAPTTFKLMLQQAGAQLEDYVSTLRLCVSAGETLPAVIFNEWKERTGTTILDGIGSTEMLHIFISNTPTDARPGCTGKLVPGFEAKVVDDDMRELPAGERGLLAVRGPTGCRYWNRPDKQEEYVRAGWNLPGDVFSRDDQGYFYYHCRSDDMIICAGHNIAGPEVENVLLQHEAVHEAAVVASPDKLRGFVPKAFVALTTEYAPSEQLAVELQEFVKQQIAPFKYPRKVEFVEALPKTPTGKIRRVELRQREMTE